MKTFQQQFSELKTFLERNGMEYLVVGGVAVQHYGYSRATMDIDLMTVVPDDFAFVDKLRADGFTYYSIASMAIFAKKSDWRQCVDFIKVDADTFSKLMAESVAVRVHDAEVRMPERDLRDVALRYANADIYAEVVKAIDATGGGK